MGVSHLEPIIHISLVNFILQTSNQILQLTAPLSCKNTRAKDRYVLSKEEAQKGMRMILS